jgi:hypothetical protein
LRLADPTNTLDGSSLEAVRMVLRSTAVVLALVLFAGEGVCSALCSAAGQDTAQTAQAEAMPPCHGPAPTPEAPAEERECEGPCEESLTATGPELPSHTSVAAVPLRGAQPAAPALRGRPQGATAPERLPPRPPPYLLHASFLI